MSHGGLNDPFQRLRLKIQFAFWHSIRLASESVVNNIRTTIPLRASSTDTCGGGGAFSHRANAGSHSRTLTVDHSQSDKRQDCPALRLQRWRLLHPQCVTTTIRPPHFQQWELLHLLRYIAIRIEQVPGP